MKPALTLSEALQGPPETTVRTARVISVDGGMAYVIPINSNRGFNVTVGGDVKAGDLVEVQIVRGHRTIIGQANSSSTSTTVVSTVRVESHDGGGGGGGGDYLPLTGGTVTGQVIVTDNLWAQNELLLGPGSGEFLFVDPDNFDMDIATGSTERITILNAGNVGIHNTAPAEVLDVTGNLKVSGTVYADSGLFSGDGSGYTVNPKAQVAGSGIYLFNADGDIIAEMNNLGGVSGTYLASKAVDGDVPIYLDSTTLVPNLNADMVDGQHATDFMGAGDIAAAITAHEMLADPHPVYLTQAEGDARYIQAVTTLTIDGPLNTVGAIPFRYYNVFGATRTVSKVFISVGVAPTGQSILVDIHKNGATIFTNQAHRPVIAISANSGSTTSIDVASWADGDYLEIQVDQCGTVSPGSFMTVQILHS